MAEKKSDNKIKARHVYKSGSLSPKEYIWHIPKVLRGTFEIGDEVLVKALNKKFWVRVTDIYREEYEPGVNDRKFVIGTRESS